MKKFIFIVLCLGVCMAICKADSWGAEVKGNNHNWTLIGPVTPGSVIRIHASGTVDFGCSFGRCKDDALAGVTGKSVGFIKMFDTVKGEMNAVSKNLTDPIAMTKQQYSVIQRNFSYSQANFDQGGVWIKIVTKNGSPYIGTQLYYFWAEQGGINTYGLPIHEDVTVYAKAHDGGKSPDATNGYGDNKGSYQVTIEHTARF